MTSGQVYCRIEELAPVVDVSDASGLLRFALLLQGLKATVASVYDTVTIPKSPWLRFILLFWIRLAKPSIFTEASGLKMVTACVSETLVST
jgi:hypothetical protein